MYQIYQIDQIYHINPTRCWSMVSALVGQVEYQGRDDKLLCWLQLSRGLPACDCEANQIWVRPITVKEVSTSVLSKVFHIGSIFTLNLNSKQIDLILLTAPGKQCNKKAGKREIESGWQDSTLLARFNCTNFPAGSCIFVLWRIGKSTKSRTEIEANWQVLTVHKSSGEISTPAPDLSKRQTIALLVFEYLPFTIVMELQLCCLFVWIFLMQ